jgi:CMP/dCMP kinase
VTSRFSVSIDGPTASGKSSLGVGLADKFDAIFLDTGLTFRALAYCLASGELDESDSWRSFVGHRPLRPSLGCLAAGAAKETVTVKGVDVTEKIWGFDVDNKLDVIAADPIRRAEILAFHHELVAAYPRAVVAGRDVGTALLPQASLHVFLTANFSVRRERRRAQHRADPARSVVVGSITRRDVATLEQLRGKVNMVVVDTTYLPKGAVLDYVGSRLIGAMS